MTGVSVGQIGQRIGGLLGRARPFARREEVEPRADSALAAMRRAKATMDRFCDDEIKTSVERSRPGRERNDDFGDAGASAHGGTTFADFPVTPEEVVAALGDGMVPRLVVLSAVRKRRSAGPNAPGAMRLARATAARNLSTIVIDLSRHGDITLAMGGVSMVDAQKLTGLGDWLKGDIELAEAIHRDPQSGAHLVPSGGFDFLDAEDADVADLVFFVVACCGVYDCVLMSCGSEAIDLLPALLDDDAALILDGGHDGHRSIAGAVEAIGVTEWLELSPEPFELS